MIYALIFCISLIRVYARAAQQLNVVDYRWVRVPAFSYLMSASDYFQWGAAAYFTVHQNWLAVCAVAFLAGTGGWLGTVTAMYLHKRFP